MKTLRLRAAHIVPRSYGSDDPHNIGDMPGCARRIDALPVGKVEKELIRSGNARRLFKLDSR